MIIVQCTCTHDAMKISNGRLGQQIRMDRISRPPEEDGKRCQRLRPFLGNELLDYWNGTQFVVVGSETHYAPAMSELCEKTGRFSDRFIILCTEGVFERFRPAIDPGTFGICVL